MTSHQPLGGYPVSDEGTHPVTHREEGPAEPVAGSPHSPLHVQGLQRDQRPDRARAARAMLFLASDDSSFVTGATLTVDGGMSI